MLTTISVTSDGEKRVSIPYKEPKTTDGTRVLMYTVAEVPEEIVSKVVQLGVSKKATDLLSKYF